MICRNILLLIVLLTTLGIFYEVKSSKRGQNGKHMYFDIHNLVVCWFVGMETRYIKLIGLLHSK